MDSGFSWFVLAASFLAFTLNFGMITSFGVYFVALLEAFDSTRADAALVGSVGYGTTCLCGPLAAILFRVLGSQITVVSGGLIAAVGYLLSYFAGTIHLLAVTQGIVGFGYGICITSLIVVQIEYFDRYRFFAVGFVTVGSAVGLFIFPPIFTVLIEAFTWRGSMLINSGLALQTVVLGAILKPNRPVKKLKREINTKVPENGRRLLCGIRCQLELFKDFRFIILSLEGFLWGGCTYVYYSMINAWMIEHGISKDRSAIVVSISGACNCFGRIGAAFLAHRKATNRPLLFSFATLLFASQQLLCVICTSELAFGITAAFFGLGFGIMIATLGTVIVEIFGAKKMPTVQGFVAFFIGVGGLTVPVVAGELADVFSLKMALLFAGILAVIATFLCFVITGLQCCSGNKNEPNCDVDLEEI